MTGPSTLKQGSRAAVRLMVAGGGQCDEATRQLALETGREIASAGAALLCGAGGGVMAAAAEGAESEGGLTIGVLPGVDSQDSPPSPFIQIPVFTGMGQARNVVLVLSADAVIAVGGGWGTLSEIAIAMKHGRPVILLGSWGLDYPGGPDARMPAIANSPAEAVALALQLARTGGSHRPMTSPSDSRDPAIRVSLLPKDTNAGGTIFGGIILSYIDQAGAVEGRRRCVGRLVTVAMNAVEFHEPVFVGDLVSFYADTVRIGRTSITVKVEVEAERHKGTHEVVRVTEAEVVYVQVDDENRPTPIEQ